MTQRVVTTVNGKPALPYWLKTLPLGRERVCPARRGINWANVSPTISKIESGKWASDGTGFEGEFRCRYRETFEGSGLYDILVKRMVAVTAVEMNDEETEEAPETSTPITVVVGDPKWRSEEAMVQEGNRRLLGYRRESRDMSDWTPIVQILPRGSRVARRAANRLKAMSKFLYDFDFDVVSVSEFLTGTNDVNTGFLIVVRDI